MEIFRDKNILQEYDLTKKQTVETDTLQWAIVAYLSQFEDGKQGKLVAFYS